jgi:capsular exopolysaccharide synthesis family protein
MSRLFEALSGLKAEHRSTVAEVVIPPETPLPAVVSPSPSQEAKPAPHSLKVVPPALDPMPVAVQAPIHEVRIPNEPVAKPAETVEPPGINVSVSPESHLVALTDPISLGAEKFRALVTRFDHLRIKRELKSFQVISSLTNEGKTLVAGNVAVTLAKYSGAKTLLVEGDLHRPALAHMFGISELRGLNEWWSGGDRELGKFVYRLNGMPLWFLPAGKPSAQPSDMLRSERFQKAFAQLAGRFEWTVVDSTPMLPIVDVNLWSKMVDGSLLVVREGVTPIKALRRGLKALNQPKLIGVVVNEATEFDQVSYKDQYYGGSDSSESSAKQR